MTDTPAMTERERYIIAQALYEFIRFEQSRPADARREQGLAARVQFAEMRGVDKDFCGGVARLTIWRSL